MSRLARALSALGVALVLSALVVAVLTRGSGSPTTTPSLLTTTTGITTTAETTAATTTSPSRRTPAITTGAATAETAGITVAIAEAALPQPSDSYDVTALGVEVDAICAGATLTELSADVEAVHTSLQTTDTPLRFLDVTVLVARSAESATVAYETLADEITACPASRTSTPTPTASVTPATPTVVTIEGAARETSVGEHPATQWVQLQTDPTTSLRTAVTVLAFRNALIAVSMDEDSESISADALAAASVAAASDVLERLTAALA